MSHPSSSHRRNISQPMEVDDDPTQGTASSITASQDAFQQQLNKKILEDLFARMSRCHALGELIRTIPAPAQAATKEVLEKVTDAFTRQGVCEVLKTSWQDALDKREYDRIPELNSLKAPSVQVSKLAKEIDEVALNALNFTLAMQEARQAALVVIIGIKQQEIINLSQLSANTKKKRLEKKTEAEAEETNVANDPKSVRALVHEMMKRERQSEKDKKISKKGRGRAGPPKTPKNPKNAKNRATKKSGAFLQAAAKEALDLPLPGRNGTLPSGFYNASLPTRVMYLWRQLDLDQLDTLMSWKPGIHKLHGVVIPRTVEYTLSLNLKFLFPTKRKSDVAYDWFEELARKVRWQTVAWQEGWTPFDQDPRRNDPTTSWQLGLPFPKSTNAPPTGDDWLNEGIQARREFLSRSLTSGHSIPQLRGSRDILRRITLSPNRLREYLSEASLLASISDKNLGIVVTTRDWYETEIQKFLFQMSSSDKPVFRKATFNFKDFRQQTCLSLERLARGQQNADEEFASGDYLPFLQGRKIVEFWSECWIKKDVPQFYGIPKIHKNP
ncbi:hypothetical protein TW65_09335 [Stemphylium lycopersici]|nr:hypothetical protein TW65_09335 [Stemphylium lycopersici]